MVFEYILSWLYPAITREHLKSIEHHSLYRWMHYENIANFCDAYWCKTFDTVRIHWGCCDSINTKQFLEISCRHDNKASNKPKLITPKTCLMASICRLAIRCDLRSMLDMYSALNDNSRGWNILNVFLEKFSFGDNIWYNTSLLII